MIDCHVENTVKCSNDKNINVSEIIFATFRNFYSFPLQITFQISDSKRYVLKSLPRVNLFIMIVVVQIQFGRTAQKKAIDYACSETATI